MKYVYILQSLVETEAFYTGISDDLKVRLSAHNSGAVTHTATHGPWCVKTYVPFTDELRAVGFEKCLKSGSGCAFAKTRL
jgi:predicted GIY-YIG superfamily endonuclease